MPVSIRYAGWTFTCSVPLLSGEGLVITNARYKGTLVLTRAGNPFVLVPYHGDSPTFKDGLGSDCGGLPFTPVIPSAPNVTGEDLPPGNFPANDNQYGPGNLLGAIMVEKIAADFIEPAKAVVWAKFQCGNYQYIHRWEFQADGAIRAEVGLGGKLLTTAGVNHRHHFYFRLDFDIVTSGSNLVQRFGHVSNAPAGDVWTDIKLESKETANPTQFTKWRVLNKTPKPNGQFRSYELIPGSDGPPDGAYSTGDLWVVRFKSPLALEDGSAVVCKDTVLETAYGTPKESVDGQDVVIWHCLRTHHQTRVLGEEKKVLPYEFIGFSLAPRDILDDTPKSLYATIPPSPF